jgi:hypothetical protein
MDPDSAAELSDLCSSSGAPTVDVVGRYEIGIGALAGCWSSSS